MRKILPKVKLSLAAKWDGPCKIVTIHNDWTHLVENLQTGRRAQSHVNFLKPYLAEASPGEVDPLPKETPEGAPKTAPSELAEGSRNRGSNCQDRASNKPHPEVFTKTRRVRPPLRYGFDG